MFVYLCVYNRKVNSHYIVGMNRSAVGFLERNAPVLTPDVVQQQFAVFADERLFVVASDIVPFDTIFVDVV